ncbi:HutD/Ves family protein [Crystallibacter degradans]|uniref:HutD/Ves family protein n=1 Tax=Crystallibacter degradans TaxID=2726743 RepID=UPI0014752A71|nr:HutD family protein [Arthrobacter sp. SF27]NMR29696.1 HutD family protein [Arthrobacter sp. SF27]
MRIIEFASLKPQPWRNGGGVTREIALGGMATEPVWRLSIADVTTAGGFSAFPGMERTFTVIEGDVVELTVDGFARRLERFRPFRFDGGSTTSCALPTGACRALNVMTRKDSFGAGVLIAELSKKQPLPLQPDQFLVLLQGQAQVLDGISTRALAPFDTVAGSAPQDEAATAVPGGPQDDVPPPPEISGRGFAALVSVFAL